MNADRPANAFISHDVESSRLFFLDADEDEDFVVVFGGFERCASDYRIDRSDFPWFLLEFVSQGSGSVSLGGAEQALMPGSFFIYGPSVPQRIRSMQEKPLAKYFVGFTGKGAEEFLTRHEMLPGIISRCMKTESIRRSFDTLIERGVRKSSLARPLCSIITRQILLMCRDDAAESVNTDTPAYSTYSHARDFIERNHLEVTNLEPVAKACGIDTPYLCRLFARFHDESPYQFLTRLRMEHASKLLLESGAAVRTIAEQLGFKDPFHFSRVFKSVHRVPPSRFRQSPHLRWMEPKAD